jgi:hypothetical protein
MSFCDDAAGPESYLFIQMCRFVASDSALAQWYADGLNKIIAVMREQENKNDTSNSETRTAEIIHAGRE